VRIVVADKVLRTSVCFEKITFVIRLFPVIEEIVKVPPVFVVRVEPSSMDVKLGEGVKSLKNILDVSTAFDALKKDVLTVDGTVIEVPINSIVLLLRTDCCALKVMLLMILMESIKALSHVMLRAERKFPVETELVNDTGPTNPAEVKIFIYSVLTTFPR
jgi:hypothetical protein